ncbi:hypothetical protein ABK040_010685 [Willaertia magna]
MKNNIKLLAIVFCCCLIVLYKNYCFAMEEGQNSLLNVGLDGESTITGNLQDHSTQTKFNNFEEQKKPTTMSTERTYVMLKPDAVQRGLVGPIITRFETKGFKLVALKMLVPSEDLAKKHYAEHDGKPFFAGLVSFLTSGPVVAMVWEGKGVVKAARTLIGSTKPLESAPGTIRGDFAIDVGRNIIHGSDAVESAQREIALWFKEEELNEWAPNQNKWIYE